MLYQGRICLYPVQWYFKAILFEFLLSKEKWKSRKSLSTSGQGESCRTNLDSLSAKQRSHLQLVLLPSLWYHPFLLIIFISCVSLSQAPATSLPPFFFFFLFLFLRRFSFHFIFCRFCFFLNHRDLITSPKREICKYDTNVNRERETSKQSEWWQSIQVTRERWLSKGMPCCKLHQFGDCSFFFFPS